MAAPPFSTVKKASAALGKSYDSSRSYFPESMVARHDQLEQQDAMSSSPRRRSDSFHFSELSLQDETYQGSPQAEAARRRSSSCNALTALCATIREEESDMEGDGEDGVFEMTDDA